MDSNGKLRLNPGNRHVRMADKLLVIADSQEVVDELEDMGEALFPRALSTNGVAAETESPRECTKAESSTPGTMSPIDKLYLRCPVLFQEQIGRPRTCCLISLCSQYFITRMHSLCVPCVVLPFESI